MANQSVKGFIGELGTKIKSNKAVNSYIDNVSIKKHMVDQIDNMRGNVQKDLDHDMKYITKYRAKGNREGARRAVSEARREKNILKEMDASIGDIGNASLKDTYKAYSEVFDSAFEHDRNNLYGGYAKDIVKNLRSNGYDEKTVINAYEGAKGNAMLTSYLGIGKGNELTKGQKMARYGTIGAGVGGSMLGARFVTGGSMTRNSKGEKDVVGVPFL